jgi:hypothetical protein
MNGHGGGLRLASPARNRIENNPFHASFESYAALQQQGLMEKFNGCSGHRLPPFRHKRVAAPLTLRLRLIPGEGPFEG